MTETCRTKGEVIHSVAKVSWRKLTPTPCFPCSNSYLVCEWEGEDQHLSVQFPFCLILHIGHLDFDGHWTLQNRKWPLGCGAMSKSGTMLSYSWTSLDNVTSQSELLMIPLVTRHKSFLFSKFKTISILLPDNMKMLYKPREVPQKERI